MRLASGGRGARDSGWIDLGFGPWTAAIAAVGVACAIVLGFSASARADGIDDDPVAQLRHYVALIAAEQAASAPVQESRQGPFHSGAGIYQALQAYLQQNDHREQPSRSRPQLADADNAFDALREFLQKHSGGAASPQSAPAPAPAPAVRVPPPRHAEPVEPVIPSKLVGSAICLGCHATQIQAFSYTLMGRLEQQGKLQCETCHGPGSAHLRAVGCASCHGDGGITKRPGIPKLAGQDPQYMLRAMQDYIAGRRKSSLMRELLVRRSESELRQIALYYAREPAARAQTPLIGNPHAGKADITVCSACHGENGMSVSPVFPNLAGQDSRYLATAIMDFKNGAWKKEVPCAACHGERGISKTPGVPSLVGSDSQYLVAAMKAYVGGQRKNAVMKALLSGLSDAELSAMALYYAQQSPARAPTSSTGNVEAGKAASAACAGCHGAEGVSSNPVWPSLAGQDARYLAAALEAYKDGSRTDATMKGMAAALDQQTINNLAAYYASLKPAQPASAKGTPAKPAPVVLANKLMANLNQRAIVDIASYYASLTPGRPETASYGPLKYVPAVVRVAMPTGGRSVGGIISFRPDDPGRTADQNNAICLNCHERGERTMWQGSPHQERGLACTSCHTIMKAVSARFQLKTRFQPDTCFQCHKDIRAKTLMSAHMPITEGKMVCSDCHNPHGSFTDAMLRTDTINDTCYKCHAEKRGPFLFEHEPVRENCLNCHDPHGSVNEYMLKESRPRLCFECHGFGHGMVQGPGGFSFGASMGQSCQNCHVKIHGSNSPAGAVFQR